MHLFSPNIAYASLNSFLVNVNNQIINPLIELLFAVAIVYFLYGVFQLIMNSDNEETKTEAKMHMLWGIIGLAIMMGVWGILNFLLNTFEIPPGEINPEENTVNLREYNPPPFHPLGTTP